MKKFIYRQRVYFSDTDAQGIVYHVRHRQRIILSRSPHSALGIGSAVQYVSHHVFHERCRRSIARNHGSPAHKVRNLHTDSAKMFVGTDICLSRNFFSPPCRNPECSFFLYILEFPVLGISVSRADPDEIRRRTDACHNHTGKNAQA